MELIALGAVSSTLVGLVVWPLIELFTFALERAPTIGGVLFEAAPALRHTLVIGVAAAGLSVALGLAGALSTERSGMAGRRWVRLAIVIPVLTPPFVTALSWLRAYGGGGLLDDIVGVEAGWIVGPAGIVVVIAVGAAPLAWVLVASALTAIDDHHATRAARVSGAGGWTALRTITLPMLGPALVGSFALTFVLAANAFGVPALLGTPAGYETVTTRIYQDLARSAQPESFGRAIVLACALVVIVATFVGVADRVLGGIGSGRRTGTTAGDSTIPARTKAAAPIVVWLVVAAAVGLPLVALVLAALTRGVGMAPWPSNWTLVHLGDALDPRLLASFGRSLALAAMAATAAIGLGTGLVAIRHLWLGRALGVVALSGLATPGSTLAVAMLLAYGARLRDTVVIILLAYVAKTSAVGHRSLAGSIDSISPELLHAARSSGATTPTVIRTVIAPLMRPAIAGGWVLVFLIAFHELTMSSLLYGPGNETLAVAVLNVQQIGDLPLSSALAMILTIPLLVVAATVVAATGRAGADPPPPT